MNKSRLEAFSDGVLAIIITIMVLEFKTPHASGWEAIRELYPNFLSYALSFVFIGIYWGNHHHLFHTFQNINAGIIWANMNLLFWLSWFPLPPDGWGKIILPPIQSFYTQLCCYAAVLPLPYCRFVFNGQISKTQSSGMLLNGLSEKGFSLSPAIF